jgi:hypothetical protein
VADIAAIKLLTNNLQQTESRMFLSSVKVYLDNQIFPTKFIGLKDILIARIDQSEISATLASSTIHTPFSLPFTLDYATTGTIGDVIDRLASMNPELPDTRAMTKTFTLTFDPLREAHRKADLGDSSSEGYSSKSGGN